MARCDGYCAEFQTYWLPLIALLATFKCHVASETMRFCPVLFCNVSATLAGPILVRPSILPPGKNLSDPFRFFSERDGHATLVGWSWDGSVITGSAGLETIPSPPAGSLMACLNRVVIRAR